MLGGGRGLSFILCEFQGNGIDAVAQVRGTWAVVEHMTEMGAASTAHHFDPLHEEATVGFRIDVLRCNGLRKAWPARAGIKFCI